MPWWCIAKHDGNIWDEVNEGASSLGDGFIRQFSVQAYTALCVYSEYCTLAASTV